MKIYIDADACPVTRLAIQIADKYNIPCVLICDNSHSFSIKGVETIIVSKGYDSADFELGNRINEGDIAITQDYGLACMCLGRKAYIINQNGFEYTNENIIYLMETRHEAKKLRARGYHLKGPKARTKEQDDSFADKFAALIERIQNIQHQ